MLITFASFTFASCLLFVGPDAVAETSNSRAYSAKHISSLSQYLNRPLSASARHLDHGVVSVSSGVGYPHIYRIAASIGVFDHLSLGVSAHWLANQRVPAWTPQVAIAFFRLARFEVGSTYHQTLYPPPEIDEDPKTPAFQQRGHNILAAVTFASGLFSAGIDGGIVYRRMAIRNDPKASEALFELVTQPAGGIHLRVGNRHWGILLQGHLPDRMAEIVVDVRFGLFEVRRPGKWWL